ncbi:C40 family peptidase [Nocardioides cavernaquae]|uniref:NlpC/P60 family protein n=1 Tax=Nocardioides cavernaquae TaxID=2321396 RepID=A0A3A5HAR3_9ACTN|nr:C40 family peptidase [Nocardioides cavernaquae]RJS45154.1 NlpC/P60 family protein [Nocardioides cavernaquae]
MPAISRMRSFFALPFVLLLMMSGLALTQVAVAPEADALTRSQKIATGLRIAKNQIGDPYRYGAAGPGAFDCSGLIYYSMRKAGISVPRTSSGQASYARRISKSNLRPGDLMYFSGHIGIFVGRKDGRVLMLDAPSSGKRVSIRTPWTTSWTAYTLRG